MEFETLETERLILRKLTPDVLNYIFQHFTENEIRTLLGHNSDTEFQKEKNKYEHGYSTYNRSLLYFQLIDKASMKIIGGCGFHNWYADHKRAELGYAISDESFKNKGIMSEALKAIVNYGFNQMDLHRIEALIGTENVPSLKLIAKNNFKKEGLLKEHYFIGGKFEDSILFAKLRHDS